MDEIYNMSEIYFKAIWEGRSRCGYKISHELILLKRGNEYMETCCIVISTLVYVLDFLHDKKFCCF